MNEDDFTNALLADKVYPTSYDCLMEQGRTHRESFFTSDKSIYIADIGLFIPPGAVFSYTSGLIKSTRIFILPNYIP